MDLNSSARSSFIRDCACYCSNTVLLSEYHKSTTAVPRHSSGFAIIAARGHFLICEFEIFFKSFLVVALVLSVFPHVFCLISAVYSGV